MVIKNKKSEELPTIELDELKSGYVILTSRTHFLARAIQFFQSCKWNHALLVNRSWDTLFAIESQREGLVLNRLDDAIENREIIILKPKFPINEKDISVFALSMVGKHKYDFISLIFNQVIYTITGKISKRFPRLIKKAIWLGKKDLHASKRLYCSEFIAFIYQRLYYKFQNWFSTNPKDLFESPDFLHYKLKL